jgi:hypothetical protein
LLGASSFLAAALPAFASGIAEAHYEVPVERYGHFAAGRPHEYARLSATTDSGRRLTLELAADEVFEDVAPRRVQLEKSGPHRLLAIVSRRGDGARLALIGAQNDRLQIVADSSPIGTPMRWLNPVAVADLDGDGQAEIAAVTTPHIGGTLRVYRLAEASLVEFAALGGFSNHLYGSAELSLSAPISIDGRAHLVVPDSNRQHLRIIALQQGRLVETGRCKLSKPLTGSVVALLPLAASASQRPESNASC